MELLHPRPTYSRANTDDPVNHGDNFELSSIYSNSGIKHDVKQDYPPLREYSSDYHLRADPNQTLLPQPSGLLKWWSGWRAGAYSAALLALISLIINIVAAVWLKNHPAISKENLNTSTDVSNLVEVYRGSCTTVSRLDTWVHLAINVLSTLLLGGSNYCMQCLCAPNRQELDKAHAKGRFLDIGVPSFRNLGSIAGHKILMWWLLGLSSIPLHLMYNSAFYSSLATNDYEILVVTHDFLNGANATYVENDVNRYYDKSPAVLQAEVMSNTTSIYHRLEKLDCIKAYAQVLLQDRRNLILVSSNSSVDGLTVLGYYLDQFSEDVILSDGHYSPFNWICDSDPDMYLKIKIPSFSDTVSAPCDSYVDRVEAVADQWMPWGHVIDYCLAESIPQTCSFNGNVPIVIVVITCNAVKVVLMLIVAFRLTGHPLITIGDAVESFLDIPDETTRGLCLLTRGDAEEYVEQAELRVHHQQRLWEAKDREKQQTAKLGIVRWSKAASGRRWSATIGLIVIALITVLGFLGGAVGATKGRGVSVWELGFGTVHASAIISGWSIENISNPSMQIIAAIFIANLPQAILSFLYLNLNGLLTSMWVQLEWSKFAKERKYLRVSTPKGGQRSTHFLQLPYKVAIPLMTLSGLLHWLISQSVFLAVVANYSEGGVLLNPVQIASCGFSPMAMIFVIILGVSITVGSFLMGRKKYDPSMPLAGSCSVAISAACHRPEWDVDASINAVMWGVIPGSEAENNGIGHCAFTSGEVEPIEEGKKYAGYASGRLTEDGTMMRLRGDK